MLASELIVMLQKMIALYGDRPVEHPGHHDKYEEISAVELRHSLSLGRTFRTQ